MNEKVDKIHDNRAKCRPIFQMYYIGVIEGLRISEIEVLFHDYFFSHQYLNSQFGKIVKCENSIILCLMSAAVCVCTLKLRCIRSFSCSTNNNVRCFIEEEPFDGRAYSSRLIKDIWTSTWADGAGQTWGTEIRERLSAVSIDVYSGWRPFSLKRQLVFETHKTPLGGASLLKDSKLSVRITSVSKTTEVPFYEVHFAWK